MRQKGDRQMASSKILERFCEKSPLSVMARGLLERVLTPERLDECFERVTDMQYTRELLFSSVFGLMTQVVTKVFPSVNAAYQSQKDEIGTSIASVYNKLNGLETKVSETLVYEAGHDLKLVIDEMKGRCASLLPGFTVKMLDGNCIEATDKRLKVLRNTGSAALPGKLLVTYEPEYEMATSIVTCEDGHAQERSLLDKVVLQVNANDVYVMDRNFCVRKFLNDISLKAAYFLVRHHKQMPYQEETEEEYMGAVDTGELYEQWILIETSSGEQQRWRKIRLELKSKTRDGDSDLSLLTNLPKSKAPAQLIAKIYRKRWNIETMFQQLESYLESEVNSLGYPKAALFGFSVAVISYNILATMKAALRSSYGEEKVQNEVSGYYIAGEIGRIYEGMQLAIPEEDWSDFRTMDLRTLSKKLLQLSRNVQLSKYKKHKRGPKKESTRPKAEKNKPHISTARLLGG